MIWKHACLAALLLLSGVSGCGTGKAGNGTPHAAFSTTPASGVAPMAVTCDASASFDADGSVLSYFWDFGDGQTGTGITLTHTYTSPGNYTVTLTVTDNQGSTATATRNIVVTNSPTAAVTVSWAPNRESAVNGPGGGYRVYYGTAPNIDIAGADMAVVPYLSGPSAPTTITLVLPSGTYYFKVVAYSTLNSGGSKPSQEVSFTTP